MFILLKCNLQYFVLNLNICVNLRYIEEYRIECYNLIAYRVKKVRRNIEKLVHISACTYYRRKKLAYFWFVRVSACRELYFVHILIHDI